MLPSVLPSMTSLQSPSPVLPKSPVPVKDANELARRQHWWQNSGVPDLHAAKAGGPKLHWPDNKPVIALHRAASAGGLVVLCGPRGVGKTQMVTNMIRYWNLEIGQRSRYFTTAAFADEVRAGFNKNQTETDSIYSFGGVPGVLVLDEAQERRGTEFEDTVLTRLGDYRYTRSRPMVLVTNIVAAQFEGKFGTSLARRVAESGGFIEIDWTPNWQHAPQGGSK